MIITWTTNEWVLLYKLRHDFDWSRQPNGNDLKDEFPVDVDVKASVDLAQKP